MSGMGGTSPLPEEFRPLYARANASNPDVLKLVAVLDAVKATIAASGSYASADDAPPTAYFAALMVALERAGAEHAKEVFYLLALVLAHVPPPVLRAKYEPVAALFTGALRAPAVLKDQTAMKSLLKGMGIVLAAQEPSDETWARPQVGQALNALLRLTVEPRPKVRKAAQAAVLDVLQALHASKSRACGPVVSNYFTGLLRGASQKDVTAVLQSGPLLSAALPLLGTNDVAGIVEMLLKLPAVGNPRLTALAHGCLGTLLESPRARLTVTFAVRLVEALVAAVPSPDEPVSAGDWAFTLTAALTRLANMELVKAGKPRDISLSYPRTPAAVDAAAGHILKHTHTLLPGVISALLSNFQSSRTAVQQATANSIALLLATCVDDLSLAQALTYAQANPSAVAPTAPGASRAPLPPAAPALLHVIVALEGLYQFKYQASWVHSLPLLALLYRILGPSSHPLLQSITFALGELRNQLHAAAEAAAALAVDSDEEDEEGDDDEEEGPQRKRRKVMRGGPQTAAARAKAARRKGADDAGSSDEEGAAKRAGGRGGYGGGSGSREGNKTPTAAAVYRVVLKVLAAAVRAMGADCFLRTIGLTSAVPGAGLPESAAWVLPLLRDNAAFAPAPLSLFGTVLYPIIKGAETAAAASSAAGMSGPAFLQRARALQAWSILPALMVAPPDFPSAFGVALGKLLVAPLQDPAKGGDIIPFVCRALETAIVRARAAAGMTPVDYGRGDAANLLDDGEDDDNGGAGGDEGLTVAGGGGGKRRGRAAGDSDDEDDDEDAADGATEAAAPAGRRDDDGATAVFGAGGVSVYAGGGEGGNDPRHPLITASIAPTARDRKLPALTKEQGEAMVRTMSAFAKNYLPVLFTAYESIVLAAGGVLTGATQDRARKLLDATAAYLSVAPAELHVTLAERLLKFIGDARAAHAAAVAGFKAARDGEKAGAPGAAPSKTGAAKAVQAAAAKVNSLLALAQVVVPALAGALGDEYTSSALPVPAPPPVRTALAACVDRLYGAVLPALAGDAPAATQKRAYAVLASLLTHHSATLVTGNAARRSELLGLLHGSLLTVGASVRRWRLHCLRHLLRGLDVGVPEQLSIVPAMLGEVMLCTKDTNNKVRAAAFELLVGMARLMHRGGDGDGGESWEAPVLPDEAEEAAAEAAAAAGGKKRGGMDEVDDDEDVIEGGKGGGGMEDEDEEEDGEEDEDDDEEEDFVDVGGAGAAGLSSGGLIPVANPTLTEFFRMTLAGLLSATPHMRSAGILCLGRLVYEFSHEPVLHAMLPHVLHSVLLLSKEKAREVIKSVVGFAKVVVSCMPPQTVRPYSRTIIRALMVWSGESKNRIRTKIRGILERMVRKLGWDAVVPHVPAKDQKLVQHMRKEHERRERKRAAAAGGVEGAGAEGATAVSRARTAFDVMAGLGGEGGAEADGFVDDEDEEDSYLGGGGDEDDDGRGSVGGLTAAEAASVAKSWGVARAGSVTGRGSLMTAVTMDARKNFRSLLAAPLPPPGSGLPAPVKAAKKAATVVTARTGASGASRRTAAGAGAAPAAAVPSSMLRADDDTPLDLLDASAMRGVVGSDPSTLAALQRQRKAAERADAARKSGKLGGGIVVGPDGRLIIPDVDAEDKAGAKGGEEADPTALKLKDLNSAAMRRSMKRRAGRGDHGDAADDEEGAAKSRPKASSTAVGAQGWGQAKARDFSKRKEGGGADRFSGKQFRSAKAAGDVQRKGNKFEPFAYVPLDPRAASGGGGDAAVSRFSSVVASTSKAERAKLKRAEAAAGGGAGGERLAGTKRRRD